ncbi:MAG: hypothetical protein ABS916_05215 [Carnobacterium sp.]|uniref:hypothetical protein n=1 Tax=Carnobacterium sp. TaxID=48221 RepID=UPI003315A55D
MKTSELIKANATLQESLTKENNEYYGNLVIYVRAMSLFRDEKKSEELLLEVLQDILDAQNQGVSAEHYFGRNPKKIADEIIKQLPINLLDILKIFLSSLGVYSIICILPALILPEKGLDIGRFTVIGIYWMLFSIFGLWILGINLYRFKNKLFKLFFLLLLGVGVTIGFTLGSYVSTPLKLNLNGNLGIFIIISISVILLYLFYKETDKKLWSFFIPVLVTSAILGIMVRLDTFSDLLHTKEGKTGTMTVLIIILFLQYLLIFLNNRKLR